MTDITKAFENGYARGYVAASANYNSVDFNQWAEDSVLGELHSRQYSPFEFLATEINKQINSEELWEAYENGVQKGIHAHIHQYATSLVAF